MILAHRLLLWSLFFLICLGLGYPTLNRYNPSKVGGTSDSRIYYKLVLGEPQEGSPYERYRVLIPLLAKPIYHWAKGRTGSWNAGFFGLLVVNAVFCATAAYFLACIGYNVTGQGSTALVGALLYLLNFTVSNEHLSGLVDSGQSCFVMIMTWVLLTGRWGALPILCGLGTLAKETFLPLSVVFATVWLLSATNQQGKKFLSVMWIVGMVIFGWFMLSGVRSLGLGRLIFPWNITVRSRPFGSFAMGLAGCLSSRTVLYDFAWLLPLGIWRLRHLPRPWVLASCVTALVILAGGAYYQIGSSLGRVTFSFIGPAMSLSAAIMLAEWWQSASRKEP